jgi:hypothetical protein
MWICSPSLTRPTVLSSRIGKTSLPPSSMHRHITLILLVKSMCYSPTGRGRPGAPCSLRIWLAAGYSSMRMVPYPLHSLQDSLFKGSLKKKVSNVDKSTKMWQRWLGALARWANLFVRLPHLSPRTVLTCYASRVPMRPVAHSASAVG